MTSTTTGQAAARPGPVALFISDLHLQTDLPQTTAAFLQFLTRHAIHAKQLYLLGDIFEYWAGDDDMNDAFLRQITGSLKAVSAAGVELFWMPGNRDFLVGADFARVTGATLLPDPTVLLHAGQRILLSHGDQFCTDDVAYQQFRNMVRQPEWQAAFLTRPLQERKQLIAQMRQQSQQHQQQQSVTIMDVNPSAVEQCFHAQHAQILIHGHTHRPATHQTGNMLRYVLSDWNLDHEPARGDWLALLANGTLQRYNYMGVAV